MNTAAQEKVSIPAIALMIFAGLALVLGVISILMNVLGAGIGAVGAMGGEDQGIMNLFSGGIGIAVGILGLIFNLVILFGAFKMKQLQSYNLAMTAAILAMLPCGLCCIIGLPIGIWALVVLMDQEVKAAFQA